MALNFEDIAGHPALRACIQAQARAMLRAYEGNPRASSVFATQQRWLMAHIGLPCTSAGIPATIERN